MRSINAFVAVAFLAFVATACGPDVDKLGVGGACDAKNACPANDDFTLACLPQFKGGYCGLAGCTKNADCPETSICVAHGGANYCFRTCEDKAECNENRGEDEESNCSSSIERVDSGKAKACVPPSA